MERREIAHTGSDAVPVKPPLQLKWAAHIEEGRPISPPVASRGLVYVGSSDSVSALDADTGEQKWRYDCAAGVPEPAAIVGDLVYFASSDSCIHALDNQSGEVRWRKRVCSEPHSPIVVDDLLYAAVSEGFLYCLKAGTGEERWRVETDGKIWSSPTPSMGRLFAGTGLELTAYAQQNGERKWSYRTKTAILGSPAVASGTVYALAADGGLFALDVNNGRPVWEWPAFKLPGLAATSPVASQSGFIYAATAAYGLWLFSLDPTAPYDRMQLWDLRCHDYNEDMLPTSSPALVEGFVYIGSVGPYIYAVDVMTGRKTWEYKTRDGVHASPCIVAGRLYVSDVSGTLYAFAPSSYTS